MKTQFPKLRYKGFGDNYQQILLGDNCNICTGNKDVKDSIENGKYPFYIRSKSINRIDTYSFDGEAVLIGGDGNIRDLIHYVNGKFDFHQRVYKLSDFSNNGKYTFHYLNKNIGRELIKNSANTTVDSVRLPTLTKFKMLFPPDKFEQDKVANLLSKIDILINEKEKEIKLLNASIKNLKYTLLYNVDSLELQNIVSTWEKVKLTNIVNVKTKSIKSENTHNIKYISTENIEPNFGFYSCADNKPHLNNYLYSEKNNILISNIRPYLRKIVLTNSEVLYSSDITCLRPNESLITAKYLYNVLSTDIFINYIMDGVAGTKMPRLNKAHMGDFNVNLPDLHTQKKLATLLGNCNMKIDSTFVELKQLNKLKTYLISKMLV